MSEHSDNPDIQWALDLLTPDPDYRPNAISACAQEICCGFIGFFTPVTRNFLSGKPLFATFQSHIACTALAIGVGYWLKQREKKTLAYRDEILRDYIRRHPEDFPSTETKKLRDIFQPWIPVR